MYCWYIISITMNSFLKQKFVYELVGIYEADLKQQLISFYSPLGKSLVGKRRGEITQVELPNGSFKIYEILDITYPEEWTPFIVKHAK